MEKRESSPVKSIGSMYLVLILVAAVIMAAGGVITIYPPGWSTSGSPEIIFLAHAGPGTGHTFGYGVKYTVVGHAVHGGKHYAVITSGVPSEGHVQIWSPIPDLVVLAPGTKFQLARAENFGRMLQVGDTRP